MNKRRLAILRDALIEHAKNPGNLKFDLSNWATAKEKYENHDATEVVRKARLGENFCGTSACAMGLAASIPEFNRAGLKLGSVGFGFAYIVYRNAWDGFEAGALFFGVSEADAEELFNPMSYRRADRKNPVAVADKITALLETA